MYGVTGANRPIFVESDAFLYNLDDPNVRYYWYQLPAWSHSTIRVLIALAPAQAPHVILVRTSI